jgi:parallel beta-helix repeat protein
MRGRWRIVTVVTAAVLVAASIGGAGVGSVVSGVDAQQGGTPGGDGTGGATVIDSCTTITEPGTYVLGEDLTDVRASEDTGIRTAAGNASACILIRSDDVVLEGDGHVLAGREGAEATAETETEPAETEIPQTETAETVEAETAEADTVGTAEADTVETAEAETAETEPAETGTAEPESVEIETAVGTVTPTETATETGAAGGAIAGESSLGAGGRPASVGPGLAERAGGEGVGSVSRIAPIRAQVDGPGEDEEVFPSGVAAVAPGDSPLENVTVRNVTATDWFVGVLGAGLSGATVEDVTASDNADTGIQLLDAAESTVSSTTANDNGFAGIYVDGEGNNTIAENSVRDNTIAGIELFDSDDNLVEGNVLAGNGVGGAVVVDVAGTTLADNVVTGTLGNDSFVGYSGGVLLVAAEDVVARNTTATGNLRWTVYAIDGSQISMEDARVGERTITLDGRNFAIGRPEAVSEATTELTDVGAGLVVTNTSASDSSLTVSVDWTAPRETETPATEAPATETPATEAPATETPATETETSETETETPATGTETATPVETEPTETPEPVTVAAGTPAEPETATAETTARDAGTTAEATDE